MSYFLSGNESDITGLKVCRSSAILPEFDAAIFLDFCRKELPDIVRIKVDVRHDSLFQELTKCCMPVEMYTINTLFVYQIDMELDYLANIDPGIENREVNESNMGEFREVVRKILETKGWYAYEGAIMDALISKQTSKELALDYFTSFAQDEGKYAWLLYAGGECVGTYMGTVDVDRMHGTLYGILEEHRSSGYSKAMYNFMYTDCQQRGWKEFAIEVHFQNQSSIYSAIRSSMKPDGTFFNLTVFPLLSLNSFTDRQRMAKEELDSFLIAEPTRIGSRTMTRALLNSAVAPDRGELMTVMTDNKLDFKICHLFQGDTKVGAVYLQKYLSAD